MERNPLMTTIVAPRTAGIKTLLRQTTALTGTSAETTITETSERNQSGPLLICGVSVLASAL